MYEKKISFIKVSIYCYLLLFVLFFPVGTQSNSDALITSERSIVLY